MVSGLTGDAWIHVGRESKRMPDQGLGVGRILIVDDDAAFRNTMQAQLELVGCTARSVETYDEALALIDRDRGIQVVVLDHPTVGSNVARVVQALREVRPDATIVGNSGSDRRTEFALAGVQRYLQKPWRAMDLLSLIRQRIEECVGCGRPLPLRRAREGETPASWVCASCGARYRGVLDEEAPEESHFYIRRVAGSAQHADP
jgi:CheY-like chemotaxis protein